VSTPPAFYHPRYRNYFFGPQHPFRPTRQEMLLDLLEAIGRAPELSEPPPAERADLLAVHDAAFVEAVDAASKRSGGATGGGRYGLGRGGDTPAFEGMDAATRLLAGGTLEAARHVAESSNEGNEVDEHAALQLGGGLHHAHAGRASGFCVYNDLAVAILPLLEEGLRVAYLDVDVHHGDGLQSIFYRDPRVLTISLHESGRYLFPGTGFPSERGEGPGEGAAVNVPLAPHTTDESYLDAFEAVAEPAVAEFAPDALVVQCGADAHAKDPLAHLALTTRAYEDVFRRIRALAAEHTGGRLVATHGGGYDLDAAARVWAISYFVFSGTPLPDGPLPEAWRDRWRGTHGAEPAPALHDSEGPDVSSEERENMQEHNRRAVEAVREEW
jgi:acetoin utilization protein AcuC